MEVGNKNKKNINKEITYDVDNRLDTYTYTKTENNKTIMQNNLYNGNGQRIQKVEGDNTINYYYQNKNVLYTTDSDENKTSHNFVGLEGNGEKFNEKKHLIIVIIIVVILCFGKLIISLKNNSIDNIDGNYTIDVGSDIVIIEAPKEDIKPISTTSNQILSDFTKNKEKALEKYEYKELTLEIDLTNAEIEELIVCVTDENNNETDVNTGLVGNINILSNDKKCILSVSLDELYDWESLLESGKNQSIYNIENFKKLKTITVTTLNTYDGEDDIYFDDESPAYIVIIADRMDEYK